VISPSRNSLASRSASRRSVFTRSAAARIREGAATTQLIPAPTHARASPYRVGCFLDDPHRPRQRLQPGDRLEVPGRRAQRAQPTAFRVGPARDHRASVHLKTNQLPSTITGASRNLRLYRRANPDGNPRQLTIEAPGNSYGLAQARATPPVTGVGEEPSHVIVADQAS
jgi:hypothetical protein